MTQAPANPKRRAKCPICGKPAEAKFRPFCSARCADIDLGRWLGEEYRVAGDEARPAAGAGAFDDADEN